MNIAIIPARGGSKRIPRKNIRPFAGKPMIAYAIGAARASGLFEHVVVSTDDAEVASVARDWGGEVPFMRSPELADDHTPTVPVIADAIRRCEAMDWRADHVCCIYPCSPFIGSAALGSALAAMKDSGCDYCFPVAAFPSPVQRALRRHADGGTAPLYPEHQTTRTQDLEPAFHDAGQFYWGTRSAWLSNPDIHGSGTSIVVPFWQAVDIDTPEDWQMAERLIQPPPAGGHQT